MRITTFFSAIALFAIIANAQSMPATRIGAVTDTYFGTTVPDPYRWLENADDPAVRQWSVGQNARARGYLDNLPIRQPIFDRLMRQISQVSPSYFDLRAAGGRIFATYDQPPKQQDMIACLPLDADPARAHVIVDPNAINPAGTTAIDWWEPSPDGKLLAVSLSDNGSEDGSLHLFDAITGKDIGPTIPRVQYPTAGGSVAWNADSTGFWYTRYPGPDAPADQQHFYQQVYFHKLGDDPKNDQHIFGEGQPKVAEIDLSTRMNPNVLVISVANGDGGQYAHYVLDENDHITQITHFEDQVVAVAAGPDALYLASRKNAPRGQVLKLPLNDLNLADAQLLIPESDGVIEPSGEFSRDPVTITPSAIYVRQIIGGPSRVSIFTLNGKPAGNLPLPNVAAVYQVAPLPDHSLLYEIATYLRPPYFSRYDETTKAAAETKLCETSPVTFGDTQVVRAFATSKDGAEIPVNIARRKGTKLDGTNPTLLTGYGGYDVSQQPHFLGIRGRLWLDAGGVFAEANLRGGGEFGEDWHRQGALTHKQNVFDDFTAVADYLIDHHYTTSKRLAFIGGSNGGLLMGAMITQHPDLARAVVSSVGIYDMLRVELDPNGAFNTTEFGTVKNEEQFRALYAYSPYHHVKAGTEYPAIYMITGEHDGRVNPMQSRKMIAALQAATASRQPIYLSIEGNAGHGIGSALSIEVAQWADIDAFLFDQLGMKFPD